ncbi:type VI secretion system protein TssA [Vibrio nigripulchritudo]|uniref:type VI secretion system protein TssA n=1 Tax=Vibrio nigripulchritudo TaxID=28173 RepID=UPI0003B24101|nr:type VI secretion system protein TssA [Vibrio nigripulchritudo]CCN72889.1 putative Type VI secretion system-associated,ImpA [Vibrio nigripulchritudo SFn118]
MMYEASDFEWIEQALLPISEEAPAGADPRSDVSPQSAYFRLKDQRMVARNEERNAIIVEEPLLNYVNLWVPFLETVPEQLSNHSKDLELVAWVIEAMTRAYGFKGFAEGYQLAAQLIENFWDHLHPMPDEDGIETRVTPIIGLNGIEKEGTLLFPLSSIPLTENHTGQSYAYWEYQQAVDLERLDEDKKRQKLDGGAVELKSIQDAVNQSSKEFYQQLGEDLALAIEAFNRYSQSMDDACGEVMPSSHIQKKLEAIQSALNHLAGDRLKADVAVETELEEVVEEAADGTVETVAVPAGQLLAANLASREHAIEQLKKIAEFFKETEPHSPVSYSIEQVVRWCDMPLPDLLAELISDGEAKNGYFRLVGIVDQDGE